ncbi:MAG: alpha/beta hydrolase [Chloroflexota bacterium]
MKKFGLVFAALLLSIALIGVSPVGAQEGSESSAETAEGEAVAPLAGCEDYVVQADDWLSKIAEKFLGDVLAYPAIAEATNAAAAKGGPYDPVDDPNLIEIGQRLCIPTAPEETSGEAAMETPPAKAPLETGMAPVNDIQMYYAIYGEGEPLILLHGGLGNSDYWENQIAPFSEKYKVIAVDSRGHGRSTVSEQPIDYSLMASDVLTLMDYLGLEKANLVGWSDGGIIGLDLAINHPERLNKVVAYGANYNTSGVRADIGENEKFNAYIEKTVEDYQKLSPDPSRWEAFLENISTMWATEPDFTPEQLGRITVPLLVLDGEEEEAIITEHTVEMAGLIPTAELILIPGTGHFAMWEKPEEFNQIILDYLAR